MGQKAIILHAKGGAGLSGLSGADYSICPGSDGCKLRLLAHDQRTSPAPDNQAPACGDWGGSRIPRLGI